MPLSLLYYMPKIFTASSQLVDIMKGSRLLYKSIHLRKHNKWYFEQDDEDILEYAMQPAQNEAYRSSKAK